MNTNQTDPRRGHTSASSAAADLACPGRHLAQIGIPEPEKPNDWAAIGSAVDDALNRLDPSKLTLEQHEVYDQCLDIEAKVIERFFDRNTAPLKYWRQERFWVRFAVEDQQFEHSGQPDLIVRAGPRALIIDRKALYGDVPEAPDNLQLRDYACLIKGQLLITGDIGTVIVQPRVTLTPQVCVYTPSDLERATADMFERVIASNDPRSGRVPGDMQCRYCRAKTQCLEYQGWAASTLPVPKYILDAPMNQWTPEQWVMFLERRTAAQQFLDDGVAFAKGIVEKSPSFIPGWGLKPGNKVETITDPQGVFNRFASVGGTLEQFMGCVSVGKGKLREAVSQASGAKGKALDQAIHALTEGLVSVKHNAPSLARIKEEK